MNGRHADRGLSVTITHVVTLAITTILVGLLLMGASTMVETETERAIETSLETTGERIAAEIGNVDRIASEGDEVRVTADHPRTVSNARYTVELLSSSTCEDEPMISDASSCLRLVTDDEDVAVYVPVATAVDNESSVAGGSFEIVYQDDEIRLEGENR